MELTSGENGRLIYLHKGPSEMFRLGGDMSHRDIFPYDYMKCSLSKPQSKKILSQHGGVDL